MLNRRVPELFVTGFLCFLGLSQVALAQEAEACLECHGDESLQQDKESRRLYVSLAGLEASVHGFLSCVDCHVDLAGTDPYGHDSDLKPADCSGCHPDVQEEYDGSLHAYARNRGNLKAPNCGGCHGSHAILSSGSADARSNRHNIVQMCGSCHGSAGLLTDELVRLPQAVEGYAQSVHGHAFKRGIDTAAVCSDCHGVHKLKGLLDPESLINPLNVSSTCGKCHNDIQTQYDQSIHGRALATGIVDSPTCNTCHGEHMVLSPSDPHAPTYANQLATETCGRCHEDSKIIEKYGLADYVVNTYVDSYHGWAVRWGSPRAATCIECHTAHWVLPARDPASTVSEKNVVETCRQCHEGADASFSTSYTHSRASANPINHWINLAYLVLIPVIVGGMLLHNGLILGFYLKKKHDHERCEPSVLRLDRMQRLQHFLLAGSFILLVITGFALRYSDAFWVQPLAWIGMHEQLRSLMHRAAAIVLIAMGLMHIIYVAVNRRGREEMGAMMPRWKDVTDFIANMSYYLGLSREKARFDRYDYTQKAEYWALVWGTIVMAFTGLVLWFPAAAVGFFPTWIVEASESLHFYEALLATLAIVVWHFFFVIVHPDVYPLSFTWLNGRMPEQEAREHHALWYESELAPKHKD